MSNRTHQFLLIGTFLPLCWLLFQAVHELGHIAAGLLTGGAISKVVLHPLAISRTDVSGSSNRLVVVWAGPILGILIPLVIFAIARLIRYRWAYLLQFFAGVCLIANGGYLGVGSLQRIGDAGDLIGLHVPVWHLWLFGAITVPLGFCLWNGLGPDFGLGPNRKCVDRAAAYLSAAAFVIVVVLEVMLSSTQ